MVMISLPRKPGHAVSALSLSLVLFVLFQVASYCRHAQDLSDAPLISERVVHLDFKGGAPRLSFLRNVLPLLASAGATALLVEYEDSFPYHGTLRNLSSLAAWSPSEVTEFIDVAQKAGMAVIPLVPTLGHLEFALKLAQNSRLREIPEWPDTACPSEPAVHVLVAEMLRQVLQLHPQSTSVHLGLDEARLSVKCPRCNARLGNDDHADKLFVDHVTWVAKQAQVLRPGIRVFMWDDMLRSWTLSRLSNVAQLWKEVQLTVWSYSRDVSIEIPPRVWLAYQRFFPNLWIATAYMGADGERAVVPDVLKRWQNHAVWLWRASNSSITAKASQSQKALMFSSPLSAVHGVVLTGWTRYDHFGPLCEILPLAVPSLVLMLTLVRLASSSTPVLEHSAASQWKELLGCPAHVALPTESVLAEDPWLWSAASCSFVGAELMRSVKRLLDLHSRVDNLEREWRCQRGWLSTLNVARNWSSTPRLTEPQLEAQKLNQNLILIRGELNRLLRLYFDEHTVAEWLMQNVSPAQARSLKIVTDARALMRRSTWSRGPAPILRKIKTLGLSFQC